MNEISKQRRWIPVIILMITGVLLIGSVSAASEFSPWTLQTVASTGDVGEYSSVALNASGNPSISYHDKTNGNLMYASWNGSTWVITTVDASKKDVDSHSSWGWGRGGGWGWGWGCDAYYTKYCHGTGSVGEYTSLAFDNSGNPRISYYDESNKDLKYAAWDGTQWVITTVDGNNYKKGTQKGCNWDGDHGRYQSDTINVGKYSSLVLDSNGNPRISYYDETNEDLKYASWDGSKWVITTVDASKRDNNNHSWGWGWGNDHDSAYTKYYHGTGKIGEYSSLALDSSGKPRISYYDESNKDLKYASWDGSTWVITTVDGTNYKKGNQKGCNWDWNHHKPQSNSINVGDYSSLALDSNGNARISYYDKTNKDLKYASWDGSRWVITTIESAGNVGEYSSLELDANGSPRIGYYDASRGNLKFASWNLTTSLWVTEIVDSSKKVGTFTSLALDKNGIPRISYYDQKNRDLKYTAGNGVVLSPIPTVTGISPVSGPVAGGTVVTITGTGFTGATAVMFGTVAGTSLTVNSSTKLTIISPAGTAGIVNVTVTTPAGTSAASAADKFTYTAAAPTVIAVTPSSGLTEGGTAVIITGTGFAENSTVMFGTVSAASVTYTSATNLTAISPACTVAGAVDVTVTTNGVTSATSTVDQFTYTTTPLTVISIDPATGVAGTSISITNVAGTGFLSGATVKLTKADSADVSATSVTVVSPTQITCTFVLPAASTTSVGTWNVVITNPDGPSVSLANAFSVTYAAPTVTSMDPATGVAGDLLSGVSITGTNFIPGTTPSVWLAKTGEVNINATNVIVVSSTQITCDITLTPYINTLPGQWNLVVENADGQTGTKIAAFSLTNPAPTITSIEPSSGQNGTVVDVIKVIGTNFGFGENPKIWLSKAGVSDIIATDTHIYGTTELYFRLIIPDSAPAGVYDLNVQSLDGQTGAYLGSFTITYQKPNSLTWDWSADGWGDWHHTATWSGTVTGPVSEYGPFIENGHGVHGSNVTLNYSDGSGTTESKVWKTFTAPTDSKYNTLTFTGLLSSSDYPKGRTMVINVNGNDVYSATAKSDSAINGQEFTITKTFDPANEVTVTITTGQNPTGLNPLYTLQYNSLTLS